MAYESTSGVPAAGTDAYTIFNGFVDFVDGDWIEPGRAREPRPTRIHFGPEPGATYDLARTSVRGNVGYTDRWTLVTLVGADSFYRAHSAGVGSSRPGLQPNQVAVWTGENHHAGQGFVAQWTDIDPGADGQFQIVSTQYLGPTPGVGTGNSSTGAKGYAVVRLCGLSSTTMLPRHRFDAQPMAQRCRPHQ